MYRLSKDIASHEKRVDFLLMKSSGTLQVFTSSHATGNALIFANKQREPCMNVLNLGSMGSFVSQWQTFFRGQEFIVQIDGVFGATTVSATEVFQRKYQLSVDGVVGNETLGKAALLGFELVPCHEFESDYPALPPFQPLLSTADRQSIFGEINFAPAPTIENPEKIKISDGWERKKIICVNNPQIKGIGGANTSGDI